MKKKACYLIFFLTTANVINLKSEIPNSIICLSFITGILSLASNSFFPYDYKMNYISNILGFAQLSLAVSMTVAKYRSRRNAPIAIPQQQTNYEAVIVNI